MAVGDMFRSREEILTDMQAALISRVPDAHIEDDGVLNIIMEIMAGVDESLFLANQILSEDQFVATANPAALDRHGEQYGFPRISGTAAIGQLNFSGAGGSQVNVNDEVAYDPGTGEDALYFLVTAGGTIPNPGTPTAPTVAVGAAAGQTGTYEYAVSFMTAAGETEIGAISAPVILANQKASLTNIPLGGVGTTARRIYRQKDGAGGFKLVTTINDNVTVVYIDAIADGAVITNALADSTAEAITVAATSEDAGFQYNVGAGSISVLTDVQDGITGVTNPAPFVGGTDPETSEDFRIRLQAAVRNPATGSPADLKSWAESHAGVESATVFINDNVGVPTNGHTTVRISGPNGSVPDAGVIAEVLQDLQARDISNITIHVATFVPTPTDVTTTITPSTGYVIGDVRPAVTTAIMNYLNGLMVGESYKVAGVYAAIFGLPGVSDVVVNTPNTNQATGATAKRTPGVITVN